MRNFALALIATTVLRVILGYVAVPHSLTLLATSLVTALFLILPVWGMFQAAKEKWSVRLALAFVVGGLLLQFGLLASSKSASGLTASILVAASQAGLILWCCGLGAALATGIRDKNLLIPISIFLAGFDAFLVLTPIGFTQHVMRTMPNALPSVGYQLPQVASEPTAGPVMPFAYIGPADFLFMGMFFVALFRFGLKTEQTARWLVVALFVYLPLAAIFGSIPLLVPIGLTVLIVNWREFKLNKEEWLSTGLIAFLVGGILIYGATRPKPPAEPLRKEPSRAPIESASLPTPAFGDSRPC